MTSPVISLFPPVAPKLQTMYKEESDDLMSISGSESDSEEFGLAEDENEEEEEEEEDEEAEEDEEDEEGGLEPLALPPATRREVALLVRETFRALGQRGLAEGGGLGGSASLSLGPPLSGSSLDPSEPPLPSPSPPSSPSPSLPSRSSSLGDSSTFSLSASAPQGIPSDPARGKEEEETEGGAEMEGGLELQGVAAECGEKLGELLGFCFLLRSLRARQIGRKKAGQGGDNPEEEREEREMAGILSGRFGERDEDEGEEEEEEEEGEEEEGEKRQNSKGRLPPWMGQPLPTGRVPKQAGDLGCVLQAASLCGFPPL
jgi:hypothetical protein